MTDPYSILGVSPENTDEQIKKAYRELAKKYHPDVNPGVDTSDKMKEINQAYDLIMKMREAGNKGRYYQDTNTSSSRNYSSDAFNLYRAQTLIAQGRYTEARIVLDSVNQASRDAEWYYIYGVLLANSGAYFDARVKFEEAVRRDPYNPLYRQALNRMSAGGAFSSSPRGNSVSGDCSGCDMCSGLICADCLCECLGGDLIRCC
ncbi:MAG: DnaJ domain-containing protein [Clostridia bacterium]|nr:DnaJ domain-containing protein [Clostridia bacterium]